MLVKKFSTKKATCGKKVERLPGSMKRGKRNSNQPGLVEGLILLYKLASLYLWNMFDQIPNHGRDLCQVGSWRVEECLIF